MQRQDLWDINPWGAVDSQAEYQHELVWDMVSGSHTLALKESRLTRKKNATAADAVDWFPSKLSKIAIIIIENPSPKLPQSIVFLRPILSRAKVGSKEPSINTI